MVITPDQNEPKSWNLANLCTNISSKKWSRYFSLSNVILKFCQICREFDNCFKSWTKLSISKNAVTTFLYDTSWMCAHSGHICSMNNHLTWTKVSDFACLNITSWTSQVIGCNDPLFLGYFWLPGSDGDVSDLSIDQLSHLWKLKRYR